jgi:hypothetical protein
MGVRRLSAGAGHDAEALLVIGVHREELAFGERVAATLAEGDQPLALDLLRIPEGISGRHPRADQRYQFELQHRAIYQQIQELAGGHRLLIDLHRGEDDGGPCADVICSHDGLLDCMRARSASLRGGAAGSRPALVRTVRLIRAGEPLDRDSASARTVIPPEVWSSAELLFVGLEVYLPSQGMGCPADWGFAAGLISDIIDCAARLARD